MTLDGPFTIISQPNLRKRDDVINALMRPLFVKMRGVLFQDAPKRPFAKQNQLRERLGFHRSYPALRKGVQIGRSGGKLDSFDACGIYDGLERSAIFVIAVMNEILPGLEKAPRVHRFMASNLLHPRGIRVRRHPCNMYSTRANMEEKQHVVGFAPRVCDAKREWYRV